MTGGDRGGMVKEFKKSPEFLKDLENIISMISKTINF